MKYLEKRAVDFKTTKKLLADLKKSGVALKRPIYGESGLFSSKAVSDRIFVLKNSPFETPRASLFHEYGHILDKSNSIGLASERAANTNALKYMKNARTDEKFIKDFIDKQKLPYMTYKRVYFNKIKGGKTNFNSDVPLDDIRDLYQFQRKISKNTKNTLGSRKRFNDFKNELRKKHYEFI